MWSYEKFWGLILFNLLISHEVSNNYSANLLGCPSHAYLRVVEHIAAWFRIRVRCLNICIKFTWLSIKVSLFVKFYFVLFGFLNVCVFSTISQFHSVGPDRSYRCSIYIRRLSFSGSIRFLPISMLVFLIRILSSVTFEFIWWRHVSRHLSEFQGI